MSEFVDRDHPSTSPFVGLRPTRTTTGSLTGSARHVAPREPVLTGRTLMATMPIILVGSLAVSSLGLAPLPERHGAERGTGQRHRLDAHETDSGDVTISSSAPAVASTVDGEIATAAVAPAAYTVRAGDTVSEIAGRFGLSTASVLALNGLGWKSLIFPGQTLRLSKTASPAPTTVSYVRPLPTVKPTSPAPAAAGHYVIQRGDTLTAISKKLGTTLAALLSANGLAESSIIYAGRTLVIPGLAPAAAAPVAPAPAGVAPVGVAPAQVGSSTTPLSPSMAANARTIIAVGRALGVPSYGIIIALATAAQESGLQNLNYGDRDSVGLFQQRPSTGWGTVAQLTDPAHAAALFYGGPSNPNKGKTRGLLDIAGWQSMTLTQAAQAVQISGAPTAYAKWETSARAWLAQLG